GMFFKTFWSLIKENVNAAIKEFFSTGFMPPQWKYTLVVLLPKIANASQPNKFRPISLCQSIYKGIAKILVNRLKILLPS
ncbi:hypothetical protein, partial [Streptococcus anginosus]|uniref:hypothetical protein n=1 Tax=Streptococcus anginosus TaxID=1328 RepID=UPI002EDA3535